MSDKTKHDDGSLREILRAWDPAKDGRELAGAERALMRRRVLEAAAEPAGLGFRVQLLATAAVVMLAVIIGWGIYDGAGRQAPVTAKEIPTTHPAATSGSNTDGETERKARQIQFSTPGGTRVIWTLDPDFEV
jgi:hypothetical protein